MFSQRHSDATGYRLYWGDTAFGLYRHAGRVAHAGRTLFGTNDFDRGKFVDCYTDQDIYGEADMATSELLVSLTELLVSLAVFAGIAWKWADRWSERRVFYLYGVAAGLLIAGIVVSALFPGEMRTYGSVLRVFGMSLCSLVLVLNVLLTRRHMERSQNQVFERSARRIAILEGREVSDVLGHNITDGTTGQR
jgi:hypothetical protein